MSDSIWKGSRWGSTREAIGYQERIKELEAQLEAVTTPGRKFALAMTWHGWQHEETLKQWISLFWPTFGGGPVYHMRDLYVTESRNRITAGYLNADPDADLLWLDSDHFMNPYMVQRLREIPEHKGVVGGMYMGRGYPFDIQAWLTDAQVDGMIPIDPAVLMRWVEQEPGLHPVAGCGTGTMMVRKRVLQEMQRIRGAGNVFHTEKLPDVLVRKISDQERKRGKDGSFIQGAEWSEDMQLCFDVQELLGERVYLDTDLRLHTGHEAAMIVDYRWWRAAHTVPEGITLDADALAKAGLGVRDVDAEYGRAALREAKKHR